jgi:putative aldouronate transport system permease protein
MNRTSRAWHAVNSTILVLFAILCLLPFYYVLMVSFSDPAFVRTGEIILLPRGFSLKAYQMILGQATFFNSIKVSFLRTLFGTLLALTVQTMMAYSLSQKRLPGKKTLMFLLVFTILFNGGMIPNYLVVRYTGIMNTLLALIIPMAVSPFNVIILTSFFASIPESLGESARIDGARDETIFTRIYLPLSLPALASITLFIAVAHWNSLMDGIMYINRSDLKPLQVYLMDLVAKSLAIDIYADQDSYQVPFLSIQSAAIFAATVPILLIYPFLQRYFLKGVMLGAIKG